MAVSINRVRNDMAVFCMIRAARSSAYVDMATHRSASDDRRTLRLVPFTSACGSCIGSLAQRDGVRAGAPTGYLRTLRNAISGRSSHFGPASFSVATLHFSHDVPSSHRSSAKGAVVLGGPLVARK